MYKCPLCNKNITTPCPDIDRKGYTVDIVKTSVDTNGKMFAFAVEEDPDTPEYNYFCTSCDSEIVLDEETSTFSLLNDIPK